MAPHSGSCYIIYAVLTHSEEGLLPHSACASAQAREGGFLTSQREMTAEGHRKPQGGWAESTAVSSWKLSRLGVLPPLR